MHYRRYGRTNLDVSVLTFGAMRIPFSESGATAKDRARGEENAVATMRRAMELGINHVDTARGYGNSERLVGLSLKELGRDKFHVTTKISIQNSKDDAARQVDEALEKLGVEKIDIMDLHGINSEEKLKIATDPKGCLGAVLDAVEEGKVGHAAFSGHAGPDVLIPALETGYFDAVSLLHWWTHPMNAATIVRAKELDIGVLVLSPTEKAGYFHKPTKKMVDVCNPLTPLVLGNRWLLAQDGVTTLPVGAANPGEFDAHLPVVEGDLSPTAEETKALERWTQAEVDALGDTRCTLCGKCMPCPKGIIIPDILRLRNLCKAFDADAFAKWRYNLLENAGDWFPGARGSRCNRCGDCLPRCPEKLDIPELLAETHELLTGEPGKRLWE